jgi:probable addiction module antidote protein
VKLEQHDPKVSFKDHEKVREALAEALLDGDQEAFIDILSSYIRVHNILEICRKSRLSRTVVYEAIRDDANPSLATLCKIMTSFKLAKVA